jgi:lipoate-protein ligase A
MFSHGTLLFDSAMDNVAAALKVKPIKIESKGTKSVRGRVANISEFLERPMTIGEFKAVLLREVFGCEPAAVPEYELTEKDWEAVRRLADERYRSWEWNYGRSPKSSIQNARKFASGIVDARLDVEEGRMTSVKIFGDFFGIGDVADVEELLTGVLYEEDAIKRALDAVDLDRYFGSLTAAELANLLLLRN